MSDPFGGAFDPSMFANIPLFKELGKVMSWTGGPINWDLARDTATSLSGPAIALPATAGAGTAFADAVSVAELWLDQVTELPAIEGPTLELSAEEWTKQAATSGGLGIYLEPVASGMTTALADGLPEELAGLGGAMNQAMGSLSAMLYGMQAGQVIGQLAQQLHGVYDLAVPTIDPKIVATVGDAAERFAREYEFDALEFRYWLGLREATHRRIFAGVPWLRSAVSDLIGQFASHADFNIEQMLEGMGGMGFDASNPEALRDALSQPDAFRVEPTTEQRTILKRLQAIVAFVEGYSETTVAAAAGDKLTALPRIEEAARRRRAEKGPGERALEQLLGLDLKPSDVRLGPAFCEAVLAARGRSGLERAWQSMESLPRADELSEPSRWLVRMAAAELDAELGAFGDEPGNTSPSS